MLVLHMTGAVVSSRPYELPIMLLTAYTVPAFSWFAACYSPHTRTKKCFGCLYFISHMLVLTYLLVMPILWNLTKFNSGQKVHLHPLTHN